MQTGFKEHLSTGFVALIILIIAAQVFMPRPPTIVAAAAVAFIIGSLLPDIDAPFSIIRKTINAVLFLMLMLACLAIIFVYNAPIINFCKAGTGQGENVCTLGVLFLAVAFPAGMVMVLDFLVPFHRGVLHGFLASFIYGALLSSIVSFFALGRTDNLFISLAGMLGYALHIVVDIVGSVVPETDYKRK
ncbi:MAG: metal-dependent hydrolase [Candidatus Micrarchaeia archaeon]|jgi:hypothetical protein